MNTKQYNECFEKGNNAQELFVGFMENVLGHTFVAGDRNGKTINIDILEELTNGVYVAPNTKGRHGPKLVFSSGKVDGYLIPDELFIIKELSENNHRFFDVKNRTNKTLKETFGKILDYFEIEKHSGIKSYVAVVIWNNLDRGYDIFIKSCYNIIEENKYLNEQEDVIFDLSTFRKINKYVINPYLGDK